MGKNKYPWAQAWYGARSRCTNPKSGSYARYGGRGIKFLLTLEDMAYLWERDKAHLLMAASIDRINTDGNYELGNCRFIERSENSRLGAVRRSEKLSPKRRREIASLGAKAYMSNRPEMEKRAIEIKRRLKNGEKPSHLAREYGVPDSTISRIRHGESWAWIK